MTTYYFGPGGADVNDGLTWGNRKLTLGEAESIGSAGDIMYFGPGTYTENGLVLTKSGSSGSEIQWIGDVTGEKTDGIGGPVIYKSNSTYGLTPQTATTVDYRIFKGFVFHGQSTNPFIYNQATDAIFSNLTVEACVFLNGDNGTEGNVNLSEVSNTITFRRCAFLVNGSKSCLVFGTTGHSTTGVTVVVENCYLFPYANEEAVIFYDIADCYFRNNTIFAHNGAWLHLDTTPSGGTIYVYNNLILWTHTSGEGLNHQSGSATVYADNNYSYPYNNVTGTVTVGPNQRVAPAHMIMPILYEGIRYPWIAGIPESYFQGAYGGAVGADPGEDIWGFNVQPQYKKTIGAVQFRQVGRNTSDAPVGSSTSIELPDASADSIRIACAPNSQVTVSCDVKRESGYAGTNPQMVLKSPGVSDVVVTDSGAVNSWNAINGNITPTYPYITIEFRNNNTKRKARYVRFSDIAVSQTPL